MNISLASAALMAGFLASAVHATPISAISELNISHGFVINSGNTPLGFNIARLGSTFELDFGVESTVDDPTANTTEFENFQVGNQFVNPPLPYLAEQRSATQIPGGFQGSVGQFDVEGTLTIDPANIYPVGSDFTRSGSAAATIVSDPVAASGTSFYNSSIDYRFTNTSNNLISFNIAGLFETDLRAEYTGDDGLARAAVGLDLIFSDLSGASITYFPIAAYLRTIEDNADGATVNDQLFANSDGISGLRFNASATAIGSGGTTLASFEGQHRYIFGISLDPGAQLIMNAGLNQANSVEFTPLPPVAPVPLPASVAFLVLALGSLFGLRRIG